ncbi:MAG: hypothetical protein PHI85_05105 [Victivallaceae bacterium]|nr:hypothetical protein [Victivallaceae bacterium]
MIQADNIPQDQVHAGMWCYAVTTSKYAPAVWEVHKVEVVRIHPEAKHVFDNIEIRTPKGVRCNRAVDRVSGLMVSNFFLFATKTAALQAAVRMNRYDGISLFTRAAEQNAELKKTGEHIHD